ncbi:MAG: phosphoribosylanthranilate isomerase [Desulfobacterales bacterium]|nr:phosphoribosylanthranilate isomerase [Desulfobacterales bacterium]
MQKESNTGVVIRTRIKVCGITDPADAAAAVAAGVDSLGFIFADSPRRVEPDLARDIIRYLPPMVDAVGVFVDKDLREVEEIIQYCRLTMVQLHGAESPGYCRGLSIRVVKSFRIGPHSTAADLAPYEGAVAGFLLDTYRQGVAGGTGAVFDWDLVEKVAPPGPVILAGGLDPDNVAEAVHRVRPFAVDVNSGVEYAPGRKDHDLLNRFVALVRNTDATLAAPLSLADKK